jgi:membrane-bound ClpP family serine protease
VPGGILGVMGGIALVVAVITGFLAFPAPWGFVSAIAIMVMVGIAVYVWLKFFPKTPLGRRIMASTDLHDAKATEDGLSDLLDKTGETLSDLRPAGFAMLGGRRTDVVTEGQMISKGETVKVIEVEGNRVVVAKNT